MGEEGSEKSLLVPRLRFPGFGDEWATTPVSDLYSFKGNNSLSRDKLNYQAGELRNIHYGDIHTKFGLHFRVDAESVPYINAGESSSAIRPENYCLAGDMVFADASEDMADIGKAIEIIDAGDVPLVSGLHTILARPNEGSFALGFGAYLFSSEGVRKQIQREGQGAKVLGLSATRLGNVKLHYPSKPDEQEKIADCLSSLDELIAAESQKLDALKTHKKGLMQQLFPREGETLPRLRFPEFREAREWEQKAVGEVFRVTRGEVLAMPRVKDAPSADYPYPVYSSQTKNNGLAGYYSDYLYEDAITWTTDGANAGEVNFRSGKFYCTNVCGVLVSSQGWANIFVAALLNSVARKYVSYVGNPKLMNGVMSEIAIPFPSLPEQQRIADFLASLDNLITAQSQKIDALKTHKQGLLQRLFPVPNEVQA